MSLRRSQFNWIIIVSAAALVISVIALFQAKVAKNLALSELNVEEQNSLTTPVYDQQSKTWSFVALYEVSLTNHSGPDICLQAVEKIKQGSGFLVELDGDQVVQSPIGYTAFLFSNSISQIKSSPRLLKELTKNDMGDNAPVDLLIKQGESKSVRFGVSLKAYDGSQQPLARVILVSFRLVFNNGKKFVFRRGFPVPPLKPVS